jgi:hypothetical protein
MSPRRLTRLRGWDAAVALSAATLALVGLALALDWLFTYRGDAATFSTPAPLRRVELDVGAGNVVVQGGAPGDVRVRRTERASFGRAPRERRSLTAGVLRVASSCPRIVVGSCGAEYRLTVPDDVTVSVRTRRGSVRLDGFHGSAQVQTGSGEVIATAFCGFRLSVLSVSGDIHAIAACAPKSLDLRSGQGDVTALVPPGRYRVEATSGAGRRRVAGVLPSPAARFLITARSASGAVTVEGGL